MPISRTGKFTFQRQYTNWEVMQSQRQFHAAQTQRYLSSASDALSSVLTAFNNQITGSANLTAKAALTRIQTATSLAKQAAQGIDIST